MSNLRWIAYYLLCIAFGYMIAAWASGCVPFEVKPSVEANPRANVAAALTTTESETVTEVTLPPCLLNYPLDSQGKPMCIFATTQGDATSCCREIRNTTTSTIAPL
jgi:hypothetical protein